MGSEKADMVFTDPPYNIAGNLKIAHAQPGKNKSKGSEMLQNSEWDKDFDIHPCLENIRQHLDDIFGVMIFTSQYLAGKIWEWMNSFCHWWGYSIYERTNPTPMAAITNGTLLIATDLICYGYSKGHKINHREGTYLSNVFRNPKTHQKEFLGHPTQKPVALIENILSHIDFNICLDLFLGSGTTLIACEKTNRKCFGCEVDPHYCQVIVERYLKYTGRNDVYIINDGKRIAYSEL